MTITEMIAEIARMDGRSIKQVIDMFNGNEKQIEAMYLKMKEVKK